MSEPERETILSEKEFIARFHAIGEERYHHKHPFHLLMHEGKLTQGQLQAWALNRYTYQSQIPIKDASILARSDDSEAGLMSSGVTPVPMQAGHQPCFLSRCER